jgi:hypothetical protein
MRAAGLSRLTYRLRTEVGIESWHWNPEGRWSDSAHAQGYWISDSASRRLITLTHGYRLPRRGNSIDQADNTGYSRLMTGIPHPSGRAIHTSIPLARQEIPLRIRSGSSSTWARSRV